MDDSVKNLGTIQRRELQVNGLVYTKAGWLEKSHHVKKKMVGNVLGGQGSDAGEAR